MSNQLRIKVAQNPNPDAALPMRSVFGTAKPRQKMAILLPGADTATVEVTVQESDGEITALAQSLGLMGGDAK